MMIFNKVKSPISLIFYFSFALLVTSCVSVKLDTTSGKKEIKKSTEYSFSQPTAPYIKQNRPQFDSVWINAKTGHTLAILTECNGPDVTLEELRDEVTHALQKPKEVQSELSTFSEREALLSEYLGAVDGVAVHLKSMIVKKNECNYTFYFLGREKGWKTEIAQWDAFVKSLKIQ